MSYKKREIFEKIIPYLDIPETVVIHGSRQVGKTTLMKMLINYLEKKNKKCFYLDLEMPRYLELCNQGHEELIRYLELKTPSDIQKKEKLYVFIDEIQYLDNPSSFLKLLYDHHREKYKIIVSGSSSFSIKSKFKDSLVGRIIDVEIFGLSFKEFLHFKDLSYSLDGSSEVANQELNKLYLEYIKHGFYPQVVLASNLELKQDFKT